VSGGERKVGQLLLLEITGKRGQWEDTVPPTARGVLMAHRTLEMQGGSAGSETHSKALRVR
jgi:hypothetical protein